MSSPFLNQLRKFLTVGVLNTLVGLLVIYAAKWFLHFGDAAANACGYSVGFLIGFVLNKGWTFEYDGPHLRALIFYLMATLVAYMMNLITVLGAIHLFELNGYLAQALGIPPYTLTAFLLSRYLVFRNRTSPSSIVTE